MTAIRNGRVHHAISSGDLRSLSFLVGTMNNAVGKLVEGEEYVPESRPQLNGGDPKSKVKTLRELSEVLDVIADAIENNEEGYDS